MIRVIVRLYKQRDWSADFILSSNQVAVWIHVALHQNLVFTVLAVKPRVWKMVDVFGVFAQKVKTENAARISPEIACFMLILKPRPRVKCASSMHQTTPLTRHSVMLAVYTTIPWPFRCQWKISQSLMGDRCQWIIQFLKILSTGKSSV